MPPLRVKTGLCSSKTVTLVEIDKEIQETQAKLADFEANLAPGTKKDLFTGVAFIVLKSRSDLMKVLGMTHQSRFARIFGWLRDKLCCCCEDSTQSLFSKYNMRRAPEPSDIYWDNL